MKKKITFKRNVSCYTTNVALEYSEIWLNGTEAILVTLYFD
jgi:hypothetical protein